MEFFDLQDVQHRLPELMKKVALGEEIGISIESKPAAKLVPIQTPTGPRKIGLWKGQVIFSEDFDEWPPEMADSLGMGSNND